MSDTQQNSKVQLEDFDWSIHNCQRVNLRAFKNILIYNHLEFVFCKASRFGNVLMLLFLYNRHLWVHTCIIQMYCY